MLKQMMWKQGKKKNNNQKQSYSLQQIFIPS